MSTLPPLIRDVFEGDSSLGERTLQGYRSAWRDLVSWARGNEPGSFSPDEGDREVLPSPTVIAEYLRDRMDLAWSTLSSRRLAIRHVYQELGAGDPFDHPEVENLWERVIEQKGGEQSSNEERPQGREHSPATIIEKGPSLLEDYLPSGSIPRRDSLKYLPEEVARGENLSPKVQEIIPEPTFDLPVLRDRAILLLLATTEQPRKSLVGIDVDDLLPPGEGGPTRIVLYNAAGNPTSVLNLETGPEVRYCPNRAVAAWVLAAGLESGPLFRPFNPRGGIRGGRITPQTLNLVLKRRAEEAGFDPDNWSTTTLRRQE